MQDNDNDRDMTNVGETDRPRLLKARVSALSGTGGVSTPASRCTLTFPDGTEQERISIACLRRLGLEHLLFEYCVEAPGKDRKAKATLNTLTAASLVPHTQHSLAAELARDPSGHVTLRTSNSNEPTTPYPPRAFTYIEDLAVSPLLTAPGTMDPRCVDFLEACACDPDSDCSLTDTTCTCPGRVALFDDETDGNEDPALEAAYDPSSGRLRPTYATGSRGIAECSACCGCDPTRCPNRVVQRSPTNVRLVVYDAGPEKGGWAAAAAEPIARGTYVAQYIGDVVPASVAAARTRAYAALGYQQYAFDMDFFFCSGSSTDQAASEYVVDAQFRAGVARFFNHSCEPNLITIGVMYDSATPLFHRLAFFAARDIAAGDELTFDYGGNMAGIDSEFVEPTTTARPKPKGGKRKKSSSSSKNNNNKRSLAFDCQCGSVVCRGRIL
ncbi:hypothetical protein BC828DRAFT_384207 [Blastocladiella britannica]|nr:hypothetical protein BC828DRAFT_384207 [Blastocladiella britannica]